MDSTYSSSLVQNEKSLLPLGDYISLLTSSLESLRRLEVTLPLLQLSHDVDGFLQKIQSVKESIELKLQSIENGSGFMPNFDQKEVEKLISSFAEPKIAKTSSKSKKKSKLQKSGCD